MAEGGKTLTPSPSPNMGEGSGNDRALVGRWDLEVALVLGGLG